MRRAAFATFRSFATGASIVLAVAAGCGSGGRSDDPLVFWAMGSEAEVADAVLDDFRREHPDVRVRVQRVPWSAAHEKLLTAYVGSSMPDVFQLGNTWAAELATLGALEPLDARVEGSNVVRRDDFFAGALEANVIDGRLVALPWYVDTRVLFYRSDLVEAAGGKAPVTWADWRDVMARVRRDDAAGGRRFGVFLPVEEWQTPVILALQARASLLRDDDGRGNFRSDEVRRAFGFFTGLFAEGLAPARADATVSSVVREFAAGYFVFFVTGPWNLAELDRRMPAPLRDAWTTAPMPSPDSPAASWPGVSIAGGASLAISSASPRKDQAWKLVEYLSSVPAQQELRRRTGDLPSRRSAWPDDAGSNAPAEADRVARKGADDRARAFRTQLEHLVATPKVPEWERIAAKISYHLERVVRAEAALDEALADLDHDVDAILAKRRSMREPRASGRSPA